MELTDCVWRHVFIVYTYISTKFDGSRVQPDLARRDNFTNAVRMPNFNRL